VAGNPLDDLNVLAEPGRHLKLIIRGGEIVMNRLTELPTLSSALRFNLGVDVGGTNTDAVIMRGDQIVAAAKRSTTAMSRWAHCRGPSRPAGRQNVTGESGDRDDRHDAIHQRLRAAARLDAGGGGPCALPKTDGIPPMVGWPEDLITWSAAHGISSRGRIVL